MSVWSNFSQTVGHIWDGNTAAVGETAGTLATMARALPGGVFLPDFDETSSYVNNKLGVDPTEETEGNMGNHIGAVVGGLAGLFGGPGGALIGAGLGSAAGGWIASMLGDESNMTDAPAQKSPIAPFTPMVPE